MTIMKRTAAALAALALVIGIAGCEEPEIKIIDKVEFSVSPNLEFLELAVKFDRGIQTAVQGQFPVFDHGALFVIPWTNTTPFGAGFRLYTSIFNEQDIVNIDPVTVLPNGSNMPFGIDRALVQLGGETPLHPEFDMYGYVDVLGHEWLGMAMMFRFLDQNFPPGVVISQGFFRDSGGLPGAIVTAFGPQVEGGRVVRAGGFALFGNVARLARLARMAPPPRSGSRVKITERASAGFNNRLLHIYRNRARDVVPLPSEDDLP